MSLSRHVRRLAIVLTKGLLFLIAGILIVVTLVIAVLETGWAKNQIRALIVRQANQYLTATLEIGRLQGSLLRGIQLGDIRLSRDGQAIIAIDDVSLSYSIRELFQPGVVVRRIRLARPRVVAAREADGRWNLGALVKREAREERLTGPKRPIQILAIEIMDATVSLRDPLQFGAAHIPTEFEKLNATFSFDYAPVTSLLRFTNLSWIGRAPDPTVNHLAGGIEIGGDGWRFDDLLVQTPRSAFTLAGRIARDVKPTTLDLRVRADRFAFQEWAGVLHGLRNIAVGAAFDTTLKGPLAQLATNLRLTSTAGSITGDFVLDTSVPGWHGAGAVVVERLNLAGWLNRPNRPSDISGRVTFDLDLDLGRRFPRGTYAFQGSHAAFMGYAADAVRARGHITAREVLIAEATALAYGADVRTTAGAIGLDAPFPFRFEGTMARLDLRRVPPAVPVPHVESSLTFDYDVAGRFVTPFITGRARFAASEFLGAAVGAGTVGTIDTAVKPLRFSGDGEVANLDLRRLGEGLGVGWLQDPRYAGTVFGRFQVQGTGTDAGSLTLTGGGRVARAELFSGRVSDADVTIDIAHGTLRTSFDGGFSTIDPALPLNNPRWKAALTGSANVRVTVRDLLTRTPTAVDYDIDGAAALERSTARGVAIDRARIEGRIQDAEATLGRVDVSGPALEGHGAGTVAFVPDRPSNFQYEIARADLAQLASVIGRDVRAQITSTGRLTGSWVSMQLAGDATASGVSAFGVDALTLTGRYDLTVPSGAWANATARVDGRATFVKLFNQSIEQASGTVTYAQERLGFDVQLTQVGGRSGAFAGSVLIHAERREVVLSDLTLTFGRAPWRLTSREPAPVLTWFDGGIAVTPLLFVSGENLDQRIAVSGTWRQDGAGALHVTATHVFLETLQGAFEPPARYGGVLDADATIRGTRQRPIVEGRVTVTDGRFRRFTYQRLSGRIDYVDGSFDVDIRLDQAPGVWLNAAGTVPYALFDRTLPDRSLNVSITSSPIGLGLIEGVTDWVRDVDGQMRVDVKAVGTTRDPHFQGTLDISNAAFVVTFTGSLYKNGRATLTLAPDRVAVDAFHLEDSGGRTLDVRGSLGTHELRVGDLAIDVTARRFEILRNALGRLDVDADLRVRGRFEAPRVAGDVTIHTGDLHVDEILERTLFRPYATEAAGIASADAAAVLNPWDRLGLDVALHVPQNLRLSGENVQVTPGTPIGLGDINLRVGGDLYLYKDPGQPLYVTGSFDYVAGTYGFQGRRFQIDPTSSINFRGDLNPEVYVTVSRVISGVQTRVSIFGPLRAPELRLSSTPPLESSDILSLIVFNTSANQLSTAQQQELAVRAGALAAGFLAAPIISAIERTLGIDVFEIEPGGDLGTGPKVTVGQEIAPGLVARFSRQFGPEPYDEATVEYYLSRILRIRATFSDAGSLIARSPFRRIERAGIDLLFFFSF